MVEFLCDSGGNQLVFLREDEELHRCATCVHHSVEHEVLDDHSTKTEHNLIDPVDGFAEFGNEKTAADDKQVDTYQHLSQREIVELVHAGSNDVGSSRGAIVEEDYCQGSTREAASDDERHEFLSVAEYAEELAVAVCHYVLRKLQHEVECDDGVDCLHHEPQSEYAQGDNEQGNVDDEVAILNSEPCGIEDDGRHTRHTARHYLVWKQEHGPSERVEQQTEGDENVVPHFAPDESLPVCHRII